MYQSFPSKAKMLAEVEAKDCQEQTECNKSDSLCGENKSRNDSDSCLSGNNLDRMPRYEDKKISLLTQKLNYKSAFLPPLISLGTYTVSAIEGVSVNSNLSSPSVLTLKKDMVGNQLQEKVRLCVIDCRHPRSKLLIRLTANKV